jgi:hypothetical protein
MNGLLTTLLVRLSRISERMRMAGAGNRMLWAFGLTAAVSAPSVAAMLAPRTLAVFERYVTLTEARMDAEIESGQRFLWIDTLSDRRRAEELARINAGEVVVESLKTRDGKSDIDVPDGMIHHWVGTVRIKAPIADVVRILQDYDHHDRLFAPAVTRSALRSRSGDTFKFHLRFFRKKVVTVVLDTENDARYSRWGEHRAEFRAFSTKVAEVDDHGTPKEAVKPPDEGRGFMWRLNTYGRFEVRDGVTYAQFETITLSRNIPFGFAWLIGPFVTSVPRESLAFTLGRLRDNVQGSPRADADHSVLSAIIGSTRVARRAGR